MKKLPLNSEWKLSFTDEDALNRGETPQTTVVGASVPGNVEIDLMNAGILPDIYKGNNIKLLRKYEFYKWTYETAFDRPVTAPGERVFLNFGGVDCIADYYLDGKRFAHSENALVGQRFEITDIAAPGRSVLSVELHSPVLRAAQDDYDSYEWAYHVNYEALHVRKAPSSYGWDIMPRALSAGLWRGVNLEIEGPDEILDVYFSTLKYQNGGASMMCAYKTRTSSPHFENLTLRLTGRVKGEAVFKYEHTMRFICGRFHFYINSPALWWPREYGEANVYDMTVEMLNGGETVAVYNTVMGVRTIELCRTDINDTYGGEFLFKINGVKIFCKGSNWVPADAMHSRDAGRYEKMLDLFTDTNCNILRCWGGNVYEDHAFFDICDRQGIMVWQDFAMACAYYPQNSEFLDKIRTEAESVVKKLRNHPSLILWSGDNECDAHLWAISQYDPDKNKITREVLPDVIRRLDTQRPYLPSSPYASFGTINASLGFKKSPSEKAWVPGEPYKSVLPEDHPWGPRDYYKSAFYKNLRCCFISEIGYHGCNSLSSVKSFISEDKLWPCSGSDEWITHAAEMYGETGPYAYRIELMMRQVYELFGFRPDNIADFIIASQISQAEADKYFIEASRMMKWNRTGIIWWNMIDGWPQFSDAVVSYDFIKKLAYYYIRRSQQDVCIMISEPENWSAGVFAANDTLEEQNGTYRIWDADSGKTIAEGAFTAPANETVGLCRFPVSYADRRLFLIEWFIGGKRFTNHYILGAPPFPLDRFRLWLKKIAESDGTYSADGIGV